MVFKEEITSTITDSLKNGLTTREAMIKLEALSTSFMKADKTSKIQLYIKFSGNKEQLIKNIENAGGTVEYLSDQMMTIQAWLPQDKIEEIAGKDYVKSISLPDYAVTRSGSLNSEGDAILEADKARNILGCTGLGIKVGVISDGINGIAASQASADIPSTYQAQSARADNNLNAGAEGLAMMEIVHDLAPSAPLAFSNPNTSVEMLNAIQILDTTFNCKVIVDDLGFYGQPWFEDGPIANQVKTTTANGKLYISAAGNSGDHEHYEGSFSGLSEIIGGTSMTVQNFNGYGDWHLRFVVPAGGTTRVFLQWNDKFGTSGNDYDLYITDITGATIYSSSMNLQTGTQDPYEDAGVTNSGGSPAYAYIVIRKWWGSDKYLKIILNGGYLDEYYSAAGSIWGHQSAINTYAVGAIDHATPNIIESFSSQGPVRIDYPILEYRQKPDICGVDGVSVTGNGGFTNHFYGTSAAAPHIAGVAALVWSSNPSLTNTQVREKLNRGTIDLGISGFDNIHGNGRANAYNSIVAPPPPTINPDYTSPTNITTLTLTGTRSVDTTEILINNSGSEVSYPTSTTWIATTTLISGTNNLKIKARNAFGNESTEITITVTVQDLNFSDPSSNIEITFPIGSTTTTPTLSVTTYDQPELLQPNPPTRQLISKAISLESNITTLVRPITIKMRLTATPINPSAYYWDPIISRWSTVGLINGDKSTNSLTFTSAHLSIFGVFDISGLLSNIFVYPNPFKIGSSAGVLFDGLKGDETVRIYNVAGEAIISHSVQGASTWVWDANNSSGKQVASDVYIYLITNSLGEKRSGKIAIIK